MSVGNGEIKITLVKSVIGAIPKQKATVDALGLKKTNTYVVQKDSGYPGHDS